MTNYNEKIDEILSLHMPIDKNHAEDAMNIKQALTSLMKELVEEAKPKSQSWDGLEPVLQIGLSARRMAIDQFEQNLLKALEEE